MKIKNTKSNFVKAGILSLAALSLSSTSVAEEGLKKRTAIKAAAPCINPDAPCPGAPVIINLSSLNKMKTRDASSDISKRLLRNFPAIEKGVAEKASSEIIALSQNLGDSHPDAEITALSGGCCTIKVKIEIDIKNGY